MTKGLQLETVPPGVLESWLRKMIEIRLTEQKVMELYMDGLVPGTVHLSLGQEAVSVGAISALADDDWVGCTYRGHHHALSRGMEPMALMAEIMGRASGCCHGMGGSFHITDFSRGLLGASAIVGAGIPVAVGAAIASRFRGEGRIAMTFFGDGACNIGTFHEGLNLAAIWNAPVVFVIENNLYGEYTPYRETTPVENLADRASSYAIPGVVVDGQDVEEVNRSAREAVERARSGGGPTLIEAKTYRYSGHSRTDPATYRPPGELEAWKARDPIEILGRRLVDAGVLSDSDRDVIWTETQQRLDEDARRAATGRFPTMEDAVSYVHAD